MTHDDVPSSVRVRTGGENAWRYYSIEEAAEWYGCNRSDAIAYAADDVVGLSGALEEVLERDDLTREQRREIADTFDSRTRGLEVELVDEVDVSPTKG
jgi:hypothetical protein